MTHSKGYRSARYSRRRPRSIFGGEIPTQAEVNHLNRAITQKEKAEWQRFEEHFQSQAQSVWEN